MLMSSCFSGNRLILGEFSPIADYWFNFCSCLENNRIGIIRKGSSGYPLKRILNFKGLSVRPSERYRCEGPTTETDFFVQRPNHAHR